MKTVLFFCLSFLFLCSTDVCVFFFGIRAVYTVMSSTVRHVKHERDRERKTTKLGVIHNTDSHEFGPGFSFMSNIDMDGLLFVPKGICTEA